MSHELKTIPIHIIPITFVIYIVHCILFCRSFDVYGFCHSQHDSLQGDEDLLTIRVRKNELQAHRVQDVGLHVFLRDSSAVCRYCPYCRGTSLHEYFNIFHWYLKE